jgi:hypothetical protein
MTTYIAGPMTGIPEFNYPAFNAAAAELRARGYTVVSPTELHDGDTSRPYDFYLRLGLRALLDCDEIVLLPGWEDSRGACLEREIAQALGMAITHWAAIADEGEAEAEPTGTWQKITCVERDELKADRDLVPIVGRTDMGGEYGDPEIYTEWGDRATEKPVLRDRRFPPLFTGTEEPLDYARKPDPKPCEHYRFEEQS